MTKQQFFKSVKYLRLKPYVEDWRIKFSGGSSLAEARKALDELPEVEAEMILRLVAHNPDLLDSLEEWASKRWVDGYSDSLYDTVISNIRPVEETREYSDKPDEPQAAFLRRMGISEEHIMDKEHCPSVWVKRKPMTNWEAELAKYR